MRREKAEVHFDVEELLKDEAFLRRLLRIKQRNPNLWRKAPDYARRAVERYEREVHRRQEVETPEKPEKGKKAPKSAHTHSRTRKRTAFPAGGMGRKAG
jgi:hypothetical protein